MEFINNRAAVEAPALSIWTTEGIVAPRLHDLNDSGVSAPSDDVKTVPYERRFNAYDFNGGTTVCISGEDFAIAAGCTRMSTGYEIQTRNKGKLNQLSDKTILASVGCISDITTFDNLLSARYTQYLQKCGKVMSTEAAAQLVSVTLYSRRFMPYYAFCMVAGLDAAGRGAVFGYDAVGSYKRDSYGAMGSGQKFVMPVLDNLIGRRNRADSVAPLTIEEAVNIIKTVFVAATERDIHTGDSVEIKIVTKEGVRTEVFDLKKD